MAAVTASLYNPNRLIAAHEVPSIKGISVFHQFTVSESGDLLARKLTNIGDSVTLPPAGIKLKPAALFKKACISKSEAAQRVRPTYRTLFLFGCSFPSVLVSNSGVYSFP